MARKAKKQELAAPYAPTESEVAMLASYEKRKKAARRGPYMIAEVKENVGQVSVNHPDPAMAFQLMMESLSITEFPLLGGLLKDFGGLGQDGKTVAEGQMNYAIAIVRGINPKDTTETLLASQMAAIHMTTMRFASHLTAGMTNGGSHEKIDRYERSLNRLARTFAAQMEALKRYRSKGEQRVYVERVNVEQGAQAIVGNVEHGSGRGGDV